LLSGGGGLVKYPRLRFAPFALVDRLTGHADPGGKRHRLAAVAARGARIHGERTFSSGKREPDDLSATDAQNTVMVYKCAVLDRSDLMRKRKPTLGTITLEGILRGLRKARKVKRKPKRAKPASRKFKSGP
jgi:hypothetical protein